jgi:hypothetical protein
MIQRLATGASLHRANNLVYGLIDAAHAGDKVAYHETVRQIVRVLGGRD